MAEIKTLNGYKLADTTARETVPVIAEKDENSIVSFRNSAGMVLFTLDLSDLGAGTAATYGNIVMSKESLTIGEGESGTFTVKLDAAPSGSQVVYVASSDETKLTFSPAFLTFTAANWETEQTVTVTAAQDEDDADETITVTLTSTKVDAKQLAVMITDDDKQVATVVTNGLTLQFNLRNGADLTDTVGGVVATNSGTTSDSGVVLDAAANKFTFTYPLQTANIPNGFTIEMALTGLADLQAAGNGFGNGYAYKSIFYNSGNSMGFAYVANGETVKDAPFPVANADLVWDYDTENHVCMVYNADGSAAIYLNGEVLVERTVPDGFENYSVSGNLNFKLPYLGLGNVKYPITLSEFRIYERALTADEVVNNYNATVAHQSSVSF